MHHSSEQLRSPSQSLKVVMLASLLAISVGALVLLGWMLDIELFKRLFPKLVAMNPSTVLAFILLGISPSVSNSKVADSRTLFIARCCAALVALAGLLKLCEVLFGWTISVDQLLFTQKLRVDPTGQPNRMAPNTALNFLLLSGSLLLLDTKTRRGFYLSQVLIIVSLRLLAPHYRLSLWHAALLRHQSFHSDGSAYGHRLFVARHWDTLCSS